MSKNAMQMSSRIGRLASETLQKSSSPQVTKRLAGSALSLWSGNKQTETKMEDEASRVLAGERCAKETRVLTPTED